MRLAEQWSFSTWSTAVSTLIRNVILYMYCKVTCLWYLLWYARLSYHLFHVIKILQIFVTVRFMFILYSAQNVFIVQLHGTISEPKKCKFSISFLMILAPLDTEFEIQDLGAKKKSLLESQNKFFPTVFASVYICTTLINPDISQRFAAKKCNFLFIIIVSPTILFRKNESRRFGYT
jgi:hypothetical protein